MDIDIIGFPFYHGSNVKGVEKGPDKLREAGLIEIFKQKSINVFDKGNVKINNIDKSENKENGMNHKNMVLEASKELSNKVYKSLSDNKLAFVVGGDHSLAIGSLSGVNRALGDNFALIWVDAHPDINTPQSSPSGNIHGMPLAISLGMGDEDLVKLYNKRPNIKAENIFILGMRSVDKGEEEVLKDLEIKTWSTETIHKRGMGAVISELLAYLSYQNIENIHISFDIDSLDPLIVPGTGTPVNNGLFLDESSNLIKALIKTGLVTSIDLTEYNPNLDIDGITLNSIKSILNVFAEELSKLK